MNKRQLIVVSVMIVAIICVLFVTPERVVTIKNKELGDFEKFIGELPYEYIYRTDWDKIILPCIPILLIGGFLILLLNKKKQKENEEL